MLEEEEEVLVLGPRKCSCTREELTSGSVRTSPESSHEVLLGEELVGGSRKNVYALTELALLTFCYPLCIK